MTECVPCRNAAEIGWWGPDHKGTHCRGCHRSWTGLKEAHCQRCHEHFGSVRASDLHDPGFVCFRPENLVRKDGTAVFGSRDRASGNVWVENRPDHPWAVAS